MNRLFSFGAVMLLIWGGVLSARADWEMDGTVLSDPDTGWKFTTTSCTYGDVTGLAITGVKQSSSTTTVIDFRNKPLPEGKPILCLGNNSAAWCGGATEIYLPGLGQLGAGG